MVRSGKKDVMTDNVQVSCIRKREHFNPHERIEGLGGIHNKQRWHLKEGDILPN
jgi:hypothetical protein